MALWILQRLASSCGIRKILNSLVKVKKKKKSKVTAGKNIDVVRLSFVCFPFLVKADIEERINLVYVTRHRLISGKF